MEFGTMRHFTKEEQKKYTESISKLYKPTGGNIMADKSKRKSYEERMKEMAEEKARKETKLETSNLIKGGDEFRHERRCKSRNHKAVGSKQEPIYIPYVQSPASWWESKPTYATSPTTSEPYVNPKYAYIGDPIENQPHTVCESCNTLTEADGRLSPCKGEVRPRCNGGVGGDGCYGRKRMV